MSEGTEADDVRTLEQELGSWALIYPHLAPMIQKTLDELQTRQLKIEGLKEVWLPCDQTIQCAVCGWVDWSQTQHPLTCPVGFIMHNAVTAEQEVKRLQAILQSHGIPHDQAA